MVTVTFIFLKTNGGAAERITTTVYAIPSIHEFVNHDGTLYRVEDITHHLIEQTIEVRCVA